MNTLTAVVGVLTLIALAVAVIVVGAEILHGRRRKPRWTDLIGIDPDFTNGACTVDYLNWSHGEPRRDFLHDACWLRLSGVGDLTEQERLISWSGLMELLDEHWPANLFPTLEDDPERDAGARIVSLLRWVDRLRAQAPIVLGDRLRSVDPAIALEYVDDAPDWVDHTKADGL